MRPDAHRITLELLARVASTPAAQLRDEQLLVTDLRIDGDDFAMWFVPEVRRRLGIDPTIAEWESVGTVGDVLQLVESYVGRSGRGTTD